MEAAILNRFTTGGHRFLPTSTLAVKASSGSRRLRQIQMLPQEDLWVGHLRTIHSSIAVTTPCRPSLALTIVQCLLDCYLASSPPLLWPHPSPKYAARGLFTSSTCYSHVCNSLRSPMQYHCNVSQWQSVNTWGILLWSSSACFIFWIFCILVGHCHCSNSRCTNSWLFREICVCAVGH